MRLKKLCVSQNIKSQLMVIQNTSGQRKSFRARLPGKCIEIDGARIPDLNEVAMLLSVNMP